MEAVEWMVDSADDSGSSATFRVNGDQYPSKNREIWMWGGGDILKCYKATPMGTFLIRSSPETWVSIYNGNMESILTGSIKQIFPYKKIIECS